MINPIISNNPISDELHQSIVNYLSTIVHDGTVNSDDQDSVVAAIDCLSDVFKVKPSSFDKSLLTAYTQYKAEHKPSDADRAKAEASKQDGNRFMAVRNYTEAIASYSRAIELDPSNPVYYGNRSAAYQSMRVYDKAISDAENAIKVDDSYAKGYSRLGLALYSDGRYSDSVEAYKKGLDLEGENPSAAMKKGLEAALSKLLLEGDKGADASSTEPPASFQREQPKPATGSASSSTSGFASASSTPAESDAPGPSASTSLFENMLKTYGPLLAQTAGKTDAATVASVFNILKTNGLPNLQDIMNNPGVKDFADAFVKSQFPPSKP
jgi:small glutamine-rich tetratricopeptide repeat-containing protein alpha